ncbi:MAG: cell division topological specificity factor MinE [Dokdonella sp.]|jgi:cell division topological specificity factor|uniref:cell division topological specificity factor MinE n=1 Tax=Dokdonella sp. TaxID=2291710 RepID=UPI0009624C7A|nr:cell division topological specificity factor MinE [Xanthomonadales bacterium]OJY93018.1 MAG: cell division topological specificity factor MinE [Xanthomonadales bacterium 63-13]HQV72217.1 cell division topological specificity factor MinE [Dokdonella sp.]MBK7211639.1 cell division topological specificity factor MinE [Xanthomonadales bacterium]MBL0221198.1 cell division topological specificity factor MinE [Xanthomonadales bacterium]
MGILDFFKNKPKNTANVAKERLRIIVAQERAQRDSPDYLPTLRREILEVIKKYVNVDPDAVLISVERDGEHEVLELSVALPEKANAALGNG